MSRSMNHVSTELTLLVGLSILHNINLHSSSIIIITRDKVIMGGIAHKFIFFIVGKSVRNNLILEVEKNVGIMRKFMTNKREILKGKSHENL